MSGATSRAAREKAAYDDRGVFTRSARLHRLLSRVFLWPNVLAAENALLGALGETTPGALVLD